MRQLKLSVALALGIALVATPGAYALSPQAEAARLCHTKLTAKGKAYAKTRRNLILSCYNKLLKCALLEELQQQDVKTCRDTAIASCTAKLITVGKGLKKAQDKFVTDVVTACTPMGITAMCSNPPGGLNFGSSGACGTWNPNGCGGTNLQDLVVCIRGVIENVVDTDIVRVAPRVGTLFDNAQPLGTFFGALPRPSHTTVTLTQASPGVLANPGTITLPLQNRLHFDASALACGSNPNNGKVDIRVGTGTSCNDLIASQTLTLNEQYLDFSALGPFDQDLQYCITWKDPGGGGCTTGQGSSVFGNIDVTPDGTPPPTVQPVSKVLACSKRITGAGKALAVFAPNKLDACGGKVAKCELANEIDGAGTCTPSYSTPCSTIDAAIDNKVATGVTKITTPLTPCTLLDFNQVRSFVGGLGFSNAFGGCHFASDLNTLAYCALPDLRCLAEIASGTRDPRLKEWLIKAGINPTADFPCVP
ncbi:MAG: hypothetical protein N3C12_02300 [Candidatus Binatia bacterium]|nr:hypothetical protein [Candidatus Binatia bacterium]